MKKYFITCRFLKSRNNLEERLQCAFRELENKTIEDKRIPHLEKIYQNILDGYRRNKGRSFVGYSINRYSEDRGLIFVSMGDQVSLTLTEIRGEV